MPVWGTQDAGARHPYENLVLTIPPLVGGFFDGAVAGYDQDYWFRQPMPENPSPPLEALSASPPPAAVDANCRRRFIRSAVCGRAPPLFEKSCHAAPTAVFDFRSEWDHPSSSSRQTNRIGETHRFSTGQVIGTVERLGGPIALISRPAWALTQPVATARR